MGLAGLPAPWSFVLQDGQQPAPVTGSIVFHQARDTVTEKGGPGDEGPRQRPGHRLIRRRRPGPGDPVAAGAVTMAPLRRDQLVHPSLVGRRPDGMFPDCRLLGLRKRIDVAVGGVPVEIRHARDGARQHFLQLLQQPDAMAEWHAYRGQPQPRTTPRSRPSGRAGLAGYAGFVGHRLLVSSNTTRARPWAMLVDVDIAEFGGVRQFP